VREGDRSSEPVMKSSKDLMPEMLRVDIIQPGNQVCAGCNSEIMTWLRRGDSIRTFIKYCVVDHIPQSIIKSGMLL
jgi:hypothetical protein